MREYSAVLSLSAPTGYVDHDRDAYRWQAMRRQCQVRSIFCQGLGIPIKASTSAEAPGSTLEMRTIARQYFPATTTKAFKLVPTLATSTSPLLVCYAFYTG